MHLLDIGRAGDVAVGIRLSQEHVGIEQPTHQPVASGSPEPDCGRPLRRALSR